LGLRARGLRNRLTSASATSRGRPTASGLDLAAPRQTDTGCAFPLGEEPWIVLETGSSADARA
jgi:hypothetical protein